MELGGGNATDDIDAMFSDLLGEMDLLTQSLGVDTIPPESTKPNHDSEYKLSIGFTDVNESLNALEDTDLDALMADLMQDINQTEQVCNAKAMTATSQASSASNFWNTTTMPDFPVLQSTEPTATPGRYTEHPSLDLPPPPADMFPPPSSTSLSLPPPPPLEPPEPLTEEEQEARAKADKIKLALEKLKEAKVKKLVVKVLMNDSSSKTLMVDERQTVREILDNLFEKSHCDCNVDWCLYEKNPELQIERFLEDHENLVETLSHWTRDSENTLLFVERKEKYAVFKNPQNFYIAKKKTEGKDMKEKNKEALLEECFCGTSVIVPELEGTLCVKEDGKKSWKRRYFLLRASGIYYVPKGKTKTSRDLVCFIQFENVNIYYGMSYKAKYKAPTDHCFILKHPQIQKESQYIKYLCCDDPWALQQWVTGIRIGKYSRTLYDNYKVAVQRAGLASRWANLSNVEPIHTTSTIPAAPQPNGHLRQPQQAPNPVSPGFSDAWMRAEEKRTYNTDTNIPPPAPPMYDEEEDLPPPPPSFEPPPPPLQPPQLPAEPSKPKPGAPPPPIRHSPSATSAVPPPTLIKRKNSGASNEPKPSTRFADLPPPPPDPENFPEPPPDFLPPPPPCFNSNSGGTPPPPPPPPPPPSSTPTINAVKRPLVPKRSENAVVTPKIRPGGDGSSDKPDLMSDLMKVLQKKRAALNE
ncbi:amyloid beta A4 precursor protein-binding family B member 1-interacting protein [Carcharodon carcharias]|uniref:amyloid beta A4 precursor protein-binding family B member 1-interacting protein n=1 Tax=Carcharodon carcharias TaxID=13397 RepID=UPI001B7E7231|nr:amyloid beta A4 precursor protein-binding family B member 1-interacting protein [Carcharodon carcharias]XP_041041014.1 amyloid beta A4 precursor protein-binding family B member 1-interacting protein [Carcharodon carcharias]XP_041041015.1 amyloid beta A4 precursor protein-binding family B member 1-interacting protein [Carcharodon carcharias]